MRYHLPVLTSPQVGGAATVAALLKMPEVRIGSAKGMTRKLCVSEGSTTGAEEKRNVAKHEW